MPTPHCYIVTVGTSLMQTDHQLAPQREGITEWKPEQADYKDRLGSEEFDIPGKARQPHVQTLIETVAARIVRGRLERSYGAELCALFSSPPRPTELPSESSEPSIEAPGQPRKPFDDQNDVVILYGTRTKEGSFCADALKRILLEIARLKTAVTPEKQVRLRFPRYLGLAHDEDFAKQGISSLINDCYSDICEHEKTHTIIMLPNGGYKAIIPYMTAIGILQGLDVRYVYEDTDVSIKLPHLPLGPDMDLFGSWQIALEALLDQTWQDENVRRLPKRLQDLLERVNGIVELKPLGRFLWDAFRTQAGMTPLGLATRRNSLLEWLDDDLRARFVSISELDHLIWKGDRVPEMVEHAVRHHTNLFALAHRVLIPCYQCLGDGFLGPEELFVLLCSLLLHDCGHVIGSVKWPEWGGSREELLLPGEIREFHNILGYLRLENGFVRKESDALCIDVIGRAPWKDLPPETIWGQYLQAPAVAGLFHRQAMPLYSGQENYTKCGFFGPVQPLEDSRWHVRVGQKEIDPDKMQRIVALLRLIDSLDNQGSRTGGEPFVRFHSGALQAEIKELDHRIKAFEVHGGLPRYLIQRISDYCNTVSRVNEDTMMDRLMLREMIKKFPEGHYLIRHYMELLLGKRFKGMQNKHYGEHLPVKRVIIGHTCENQQPNNRKLIFSFDVEIDESLIIDKQFDAEDQRKRVVGKMSEERAGIADILDKAGIRLCYRL